MKNFLKRIGHDKLVAYELVYDGEPAGYPIHKEPDKIDDYVKELNNRPDNKVKITYRAFEESLNEKTVSPSDIKKFLKEHNAKEVNFGSFSGIKRSGKVDELVAYGSKKVSGTYDETTLYVYKEGARLIEKPAKLHGKSVEKFYKFEKPIEENLNEDVSNWEQYYGDSVLVNRYIKLVTPIDIEGADLDLVALIYQNKKDEFKFSYELFVNAGADTTLISESSSDYLSEIIDLCLGAIKEFDEKNNTGIIYDVKPLEPSKSDMAFLRESINESLDEISNELKNKVTARRRADFDKADSEYYSTSAKEGVAYGTPETNKALDKAYQANIKLQKNLKLRATDWREKLDGDEFVILKDGREGTLGGLVYDKDNNFIGYEFSTNPYGGYEYEEIKPEDIASLAESKINEISDKTAFKANKQRAKNWRDSGYARGKELAKLNKSDKLMDKRTARKGVSTEQAIDNLVNIGFDKLSAYKPHVAKSAKGVLNRAVDKGLAVPHDFGRGKGKYHTNLHQDDVALGLIDDEETRNIANRYLKKQQRNENMNIKEAILKSERLLNEAKWDNFAGHSLPNGDKDDRPIEVVFKKENDDVLALFPKARFGNSKTIPCYVIHSTLELKDYSRERINSLKNATATEYFALKKELESMGYNLVVINESKIDENLSYEEYEKIARRFRCPKSPKAAAEKCIAFLRYVQRNGLEDELLGSRIFDSYGENGEAIANACFNAIIRECENDNNFKFFVTVLARRYMPVEAVLNKLEEAKINENSAKKAIDLYKKHGMLFLDDAEGKKAYRDLLNAGYTMKKNSAGDVAYCIELDRMSK